MDFAPLKRMEGLHRPAVVGIKKGEGMARFSLLSAKILARRHDYGATLLFPFRASGAAAWMDSYCGSGRSRARRAVWSRGGCGGNSESQAPHRWAGRLQETASREANRAC